MGEVRGMCRTKYPRFYLCFCLCRRSDLLKEEKQYSKAFEANERLIELIDNNILSKQCSDLSHEESKALDLRAEDVRRLEQVHSLPAVLVHPA